MTFWFLETFVSKENEGRRPVAGGASPTTTLYMPRGAELVKDAAAVGVGAAVGGVLRSPKRIAVILQSFFETGAVDAKAHR